MRLASIKYNQQETAALVIRDAVIPVKEINRQINTGWPEDLFAIISSGRLEEMVEWYNTGTILNVKFSDDVMIQIVDADFAPLYRSPNKIWGIGLNYKAHAAELDEKQIHGEPGSFMKPSTTIIGYGDTIEIPVQSEKTTGEGELGIIFGKKCKNIKKEDWLSVVAGFTTIVDMTAEDILRRNVRYLTSSKSFDTFFSFGPVFVTTDEIDNVNELTVQTYLNSELIAENQVKNMTFTPDFLVSYHSKIMTMLPGDIISSGTPGTAKLSNGDIVECRIDGFTTLKNPVKDLKIK
ncbi:fumarylacetoacetate hydrolase family protein [candidate division KSB1 bacterium]